MPDQSLPNDLSKSEAALAVGSIIGETYRVLAYIGQGGMGFVYKVEHLMMGKTMALKILRSEQVTGDVWLRFRAEAQAIARLDHVNVVRIYDMSQTKEGKPFYTMDLLVGESLADYLERGPMPVKEALHVFRQVCSGLAYAHDHGIIHRDIKPANIMLIGDKNSPLPPLVKIVDFGIAKLTARDGNPAQGLTRPGEVFGSPLYMSPEQCSGVALDNRTDMYSVGVTMFQTLTGRPPLLGKSAIETTSMHLNVIPHSMSEETGTAFPERLEEIVARLLEKAPENRFDSLADVASELLTLEKGTTVHADTLTKNGTSKKITAHNKIFSSEQNYSDTTSRTTNFSSSTGGVRNILISCLVVLTVIGTGIYFWYTQATRIRSNTGDLVTDANAPGTGKTTASMLIEEIGSDATVHEPLNQDDLSTETKGKIEYFLRTRHALYSHFENLQGSRFKVFEFPEEFSLGVFIVNPQYGVRSVTKTARGKILLPDGVLFKLEIGDSIKTYPDLLRYFSPDDLQWISAEQMSVVTPALKKNLARFSGISSLSMMNTPLADEDLPWMDKFTRLQGLNVSATKVTAVALAKLKRLPKLRCLEMQNICAPLPVLKTLAQSGEITELDVSHTGAASADVEQIAKMHKLIRLSCKRDNLVDADLAKLASLKQLIDLDIQTNTKLTSRIAEILKSFKQLQVLTLPYDLLSEEKDKELMNALPNLHTSESRNGL